MRSADETAEAARRLAQLRWSPEARLRSAVRYTAANADDLDAAQKATLEAAITAGAEDTDD